MSDDDAESIRKREEFVAWYESVVTKGEPVDTWTTDEIVCVYTNQAGAAAIDFVFAKSPDNRAMVWRLEFGPEAARLLKSALIKAENIPDTPPSTRGARAIN